MRTMDELDASLGGIQMCAPCPCGIEFNVSRGQCSVYHQSMLCNQCICPTPAPPVLIPELTSYTYESYPVTYLTHLLLRLLCSGISNNCPRKSTFLTFNNVQEISTPITSGKLFSFEKWSNVRDFKVDKLIVFMIF